MISREFVRKYLEIQDMLERREVAAERYTELIISLCAKYQVDPAKLAEYNMNLEPRKFEYG